jgi:hypothetical protein
LAGAVKRKKVSVSHPLPSGKLLAPAAVPATVMAMKKWIIRIAIVLVALVILALVAVGMFLDQAVKKGVETVGPQLTKVSIKLDSVGISILTGSGKVKGLEVGNPEGYKAASAMKLGSASVAVSPGSLMADKIVIKHIRVEAPEINIEGSPTKNNLTKILDNVQAATGGSGTETQPTTEEGANLKLQVDEFVLTGAKVNYTIPGVGTFPLVLPDIKMTNLGTGPDGITAGDLTERVLSELTVELIPVLTKAASDAGKKLLDGSSGDVNKTVKGVTDLFKKKSD